MRNLTISKKLIIGFGIIILMMIISTALSAYSINNIDKQVQMYSKYTVPNSEYLADIRLGMEGVKQEILLAIEEKDTKSISEALESAETHGAEVTKYLDLYADNQRNHDRDADIEKIKKVISSAVETREEISELVKNPSDENSDKALKLYLEQYQPTLTQVTDILDDFSQTAKDRAKEQSVTADSVTRTSWILLISSLVIILLLAVISITIIRKSILRPVQKIMNAYDEIEKGNMQVQIAYESQDEMGTMAKSIQRTNTFLFSYISDITEKLEQISQGNLLINVDLDYIGDFSAIKQALQSTVSSLNYTMLAINTAAEQVSAGASQIASGAQSLATGSTEQAASVEQLTVSISEIAEEATKNSIHVKEAAQYIEQVGEDVRDGNKYMKQLTEAMSNIGSASNEITNITKLIEDIAFQTNILSLNAAIEAARAGDAGKGFAVVADEVRNLAAKSAEAAKKTEELILASVATVSEGSQITGQTAQTLQNIEEKTQMIHEDMQKVNQASLEQTAAIEQIKQGITLVSSIVQENAAAAEENSATSEEMYAQAATLHERIGNFKLNMDYESDSLSTIPLQEDPAANIEAREAASTLERY